MTIMILLLQIATLAAAFTDDNCFSRNQAQIDQIMGDYRAYNRNQFNNSELVQKPQNHNNNYWLIKDDITQSNTLILKIIKDTSLDEMNNSIQPYEILYNNVEKNDQREKLEEFGDLLIYQMRSSDYSSPQHLEVRDHQKELESQSDRVFEFILTFLKDHQEYLEHKLILFGDDETNEVVKMIADRIDQYNRPRFLEKSPPKNKIRIVSSLKIKHGHYLKSSYLLPDEERDGNYMNPEFTGAFIAYWGIPERIYKAIEYAWTFSNSLGFCLYPKNPTFALPFFSAYLQQFGVSIEDLYEKCRSSIYFGGNRKYQRREQPAIPLITHRIWITTRPKGNEIFTYYENSTVMQNIVNQQKAMDDENHKWQHYIWTNSKAAIPESVKWLEENGFVVKELSELKLLDKDIQNIIYDYEIERFGAASDLARMAVVYEYGGFYQDMDNFIYQWDNEIMHYFDSIQWKFNMGFDAWTLTNNGFLMKPQHPILHSFLETYKKFYYSKGTDEEPIHFSECYEQTKIITFYETGPFFNTALFVQYLKRQEGVSTVDVVLRDLNANGPQTYYIHTNNNEVKEVSIWGQDLGGGTWMDDYLDALSFGFKY